MVITGTNLHHSIKARDLAAKYEHKLFATAGVHPHEATDWHSAVADSLAALAEAPEIVAIGETGLDFNRNFSPRRAQEFAFEAQLDLAAALHLPVFIHERDAHENVHGILARYRSRLVAAVIHCFTGTRVELAAYLDLDLHIGITGWICDERRGVHLRQLIKDIPAGRLMLETDAPFLLPKSLVPRPKGGRNEPAFLRHILSEVAACAGQSIADVAAATTCTARTFFAIDPSPIGPSRVDC
jgi:TatD DNase family protein